MSWMVDLRDQITAAVDAVWSLSDRHLIRAMTAGRTDWRAMMQKAERTAGTGIAPPFAVIEFGTPVRNTDAQDVGDPVIVPFSAYYILGGDPVVVQTDTDIENALIEAGSALVTRLLSDTDDAYQCTEAFFSMDVGLPPNQYFLQNGIRLMAVGVDAQLRSGRL